MEISAKLGEGWAIVNKNVVAKDWQGRFSEATAYRGVDQNLPGTVASETRPYGLAEILKDLEAIPARRRPLQRGGGATKRDSCETR
jgi:hypothetical protein